MATVSANGDREIGDVIKDAMLKVGSEGSITVDEGHSRNTTIEIVEGFRISRGAEGGEVFFQNSPNRDRFEHENCFVILYDHRIETAVQIQNIISGAEKQNTLTNKLNPEQPNYPPILIIANDFSAIAMAALCKGIKEFNLSLCAIKSPDVTQERTKILDDMAVMLGGERLGSGARTLDRLEGDDFGLCDKVSVTKNCTTFTGNQGKEEEIAERINQLKAQIPSADNPYDQQLVKDRIANLAQGVARIGVGGDTDLEIKEKYHRIEDALNSARAAVESGIVPGGGSIFYRIARLAKYHKDIKDTQGGRVVLKALEAPFRQIVKNIGLEFKDCNDILGDPNRIYDAEKRDYVNGLEGGIVDPVKTLETALRNAVSICGLLSTFGGVVLAKRSKSNMEQLLGGG